MLKFKNLQVSVSLNTTCSCHSTGALFYLRAAAKSRLLVYHTDVAYSVDYPQVTVATRNDKLNRRLAETQVWEKKMWVCCSEL